MTLSFPRALKPKRETNKKILFEDYEKKKKRQGCESASEELSFEWSRYRISSTNSEFTTALAVFAINLTERFEYKIYYIQTEIRLINSSFYQHL